MCIRDSIYVMDEIADAFEEALADLASTLTVGPGLEEADVGPMVSARQRDHVLSQVTQAVEAGASMRVGSASHRDNFIDPIVLTGVTEAMDIGSVETFGPVACVTRVANVDEAVTRANDSPFGLGAVVFGGDTERAAQVGRRLTAGMVGVNRAAGGVAGTPWVGARESGLGYHKSPAGHRQFTQARVLTVAS